MVSGNPLSDREKAYIRANKHIFSFSKIAKDLGESYPLDNGGFRNKQSIRNEVRRLKNQPYAERHRDKKSQFLHLQIADYGIAKEIEDIMKSSQDLGLTKELADIILYAFFKVQGRNTKKRLRELIIEMRNVSLNP